MENASKALLIAGAILLAILIISLGVILFNNMSLTVKNNTSMSEQEISSFNSKIIPYVGKNVSGSKVNALIQLIYSINNNDTIGKVVITFPNGKIGEDGKYTGTSRKVETGKFYSVNATYNTQTGLISQINVN